MWLRRRSRARHLAEEEEDDLVIDLRERLAPYGRPDAEIDEHVNTDDAERHRRGRPLRSS